MKSLLRQHRYALAVTLRRLAAAPISSLTNLLVIALALSLPLLGASLLVSMQPVARQVSVTPELTVFLKIDAPKTAAEQVATRIRKEHAEQVAGVRIVTKDRALTELRTNPAWEQALKVLPGNPLPDAIVVSLTPGDQLAERADKLAQVWRKWPGVDLVQLDTAWVQRLEALLRFGRIGLLLLALSVALVVLATVFNTHAGLIAARRNRRCPLGRRHRGFCPSTIFVFRLGHLQPGGTDCDWDCTRNTDPIK